MCRPRLPDDPVPEVRAMEGKGNIQASDLLDPTPELPDDTPLDRVQFPTRVQAALAASSHRTVGEIRESPNKMLLDLQDLGSGSVFYLREALGLPSCDGVRPSGRKPQ
jgi:hypothetical protein